MAQDAYTKRGGHGRVGQKDSGECRASYTTLDAHMGAFLPISDALKPFTVDP